MFYPKLEQSKVINITSIGDILFRKSKRAKHFRISIKPKKGVVVTIPQNATFKSGEKIVEGKLEWINKHLAKMKSFENNELVFDETTDFSTRNHKLFFHPTDVQRISFVISTSEIIVNYPDSFDIKSHQVQNAARSSIVEALRDEAKKHIPSRVAVLAKKYNFQFNKVFIKNLRSRWGSCSQKNNINLSLHLMRVPDHLIDYVILHELVHTVEKNHGANFWELLNSVTDNNAKLLGKELKKFSLAW